MTIEAVPVLISNAGKPSGTGWVQVLSPDGVQVKLLAGGRLTFGRGHEADLFVPSGRDLSRQAGEIIALGGGAWVGNLSHTHGLYVRGEDYHVRLPPSGENGPSGGWLVSRGTAVVGSMAMIRKDLALRVTVAAEPGSSLTAGVTGQWDGCDTEESTLRPILLRPHTKLYLVALLLCYPWLLDPSHTAPLPTAPQIARAALELTSARYQLARLDDDPEFRSNLVGQVNDHLKYLRERVQVGSLAPPGTRVTPAVIAQALLANDVITRADLATIDKPEWRSRQEDIWWRTLS